MDLALDSSTPRLSMTGGDGSAQATVVAPEDRRGNKHLVRGLNEICRNLGCGPADFMHIFLTVGPGSFTGARIGIAFVLGLACRRSVRIHPVNTLLAIALGWEGGGPALSILPAGKNIWYAAVYSKGKRISEISVPAVVCAAGLQKLARKAKPVALAADPALPFEPFVIPKPLSLVLFENRKLCPKAEKVPRPIYLKSLYDDPAR